MWRSKKSTQEDEGDFESVFDVDSIKYQMVTELVQVSYHTEREDVQELGVLWLRHNGEEGGCPTCHFVVRFARNCRNLGSTAKVALQTLCFKGRPPYKRENVMIAHMWKTSFKPIICYILIFKHSYLQHVPKNLEP